MQIDYLAGFFRQLEWWKLVPANELLAEQPGKEVPHQFVSLLRSEDNNTLLAYIPEKATAKIYNKANATYDAQWFNPVSNQYSKARLVSKEGIIEAASPGENDMVFICRRSRLLLRHIKTRENKNIYKQDLPLYINPL